MYKFNNDGSLQPNTIFHRSFDKLHSRCIEYPFAASKITEVGCLLDVGSIKSNDIWIEWLDNLSIPVYLTDYDTSNIKFKHAKFYTADIRKLPFSNNSFDKISAISVIEHIGLSKPQVNSNVLPIIDENGDWDVTWRRIPLKEVKATNQIHIDGIICGVWKKI